MYVIIVMFVMQHNITYMSLLYRHSLHF